MAMSHAIPSVEPSSLRAGDLATWRISLSDYPASAGWMLSYTLVRSGMQIQFSASADGDDHLVSVPASTTTGWAAGGYDYIGRVSKGAEAYTVRTGHIEVLRDFETASGGYDGRSHARRTLEALEAWIESRDLGVASYEIAGRRLSAISITDLLVLRDRYRREVAAEEAARRTAAGLPGRRKLLVRFGGR